MIRRRKSELARIERRYARRDVFRGRGKRRVRWMFWGAIGFTAWVSVAAALMVV